MKILVTGARGMVGTELLRQAPKHPFVQDLRCPELDVSNLKQVAQEIKKYEPRVILHLAGKTGVDWCEENPEECYNINVQGTRNVCEAAQSVGALLVYPSTCYIYSGEKMGPYDERVDKVITEKIVGVYSKSKWEAENAVREVCGENYIIARLGALFGGGKQDKKFVGKIVEKVRSGIKEIPAVNDRAIQPSSIKDTIHNLLQLIEVKGRGIFNMVGHGSATYYDYARAIVEFLGVDGVQVIPISSSAFVESAPRAKNLTALNGRLQEMKIDFMRDWKITLKEYIYEYFR